MNTKKTIILASLACMLAISCNTDTTVGSTGRDNGVAVDKQKTTKDSVKVNGASSNRNIPNGTGTEPKKIDSGTKKGKWPSQGDPFS